MGLKTISSVLLKPTEKLVIKLSVSLLTQDGKNGYYNIYEKGNTGYMIVDTSSVLRLEYKEPGTEWDRGMYVYITQNNIYQLIKGLDEVKELFDTEKLFRENEFKELKSLPHEPHHTIYIDNIGVGQCLKFTPSVIYDKSGKDLMGMYMFINNTTRAVDLSIDEFEAIWYTIKHVNIRQESQNLINLCLLEQLKNGIGASTLVTNENINDTKRQIKEHLNSAGATSIFDLVNKRDENRVDKESVTGGIKHREVPSSLDDL